MGGWKSFESLGNSEVDFDDLQCRFGRKFKRGNGILDKWCLPLTVRRDSIDGAGYSEVLGVAETSIPYLTM